MVKRIFRSSFSVWNGNFLNFLRRKSGQLKIQQMAFMLIAVTLFFVLVGLFILSVKLTGMKESATAFDEKNSMLLVTKIANSPEFSCGFAFDETKLACIDADKVMMLKESISKYKNFWQVDNIEIRKIYPAGDIVCTTRNYPDCNIIRLRSEEVSGFDLSNFVSLCRKDAEDGEIYNKCELAKIMVSYKNVE